MRARGGALAAILILSLAGVPAGAWDQLRGGPERSGVALLPERPLDVVAYRTVLPENEDLRTVLGPNWAMTPHGLVGVARDNATGACTLVKVAEAGQGAVSRIPLDGCIYPWFQGYDPVQDAVLVCTIDAADRGAFQARSSSDGRVLWEVRPARDLGIVDPGNHFIWTCSGAALDLPAREAVVPFLNGRWGPDVYRHRIAAVDLDTGQVRWATQIPNLAPTVLPAGLPLAPDGSGADFIPISITASSGGIVVTAIVICPDVATCDVPPPDGSREPAPFQTAAAWLTRDGAVRGMALSRHDHRTPDPPRDATGRTAGGAFWAASGGPYAAASLGGYLVLINPEDPDWLASAPLTTVERSQWGVDALASPIWTPDAIVVPFYRTVTSFNPVDLSKRWAWAMREGGWLVSDLLATSTGDLMVLANKAERSSRANAGLQSSEAMLVKLDGTTGQELQRVPLRAESWMAVEPVMTIPGANRGLAFPRTPVLVPLPGGLAVTDMRGNLVLLSAGTTGKAPALALGDTYPAPGDAVDLVVQGAGEAPVRVLVRWGDGLAEDAAAPGPDGAYRFQHAWGAPARHEVLVTAVYADGRTGTSTAIVDVGGDPPPDLTFLQQAFAPENQDLTFGVLGLALAAMGGLYAGSMRLRHRGRLQRAMEEVDAAFAASRDRPAEVEASLGELRDRYREHTLQGRLLDAQFAVLNAHVDGLLRQNRRRLLEGRVAFLPHGTVLMLQEMLADGRLTGWERQQFLAAVDAERTLTPEQRAIVLELLDEWGPAGGSAAGRGPRPPPAQGS